MKKKFYQGLLTIALTLLLGGPVACHGATIYTSHASPTDGVDYTYSVSGTCALCAVADTSHIADASLTNYASVVVPAGVGTSVTLGAKLELEFLGTGYSGFLIESNTGLLDSLVLGNITVYTYHQGALVDSFGGSAFLELIPSAGNQQYIEVQHSGTIDEIAIAFSGLASTPWDLRVYYGYASTTSIMPMVLTSFQGRALEGHRVQLEWTTAQEMNNSHFLVERSDDGAAWEAIARVEGAGNSSEPLDYLHVDPAPAHGANLYRLRQVDHDGASTLGSVLMVSLGRTQAALHIGPNPTASALNLAFQGVEEGAYRLQILDSRGTLLLDGTVAVSSPSFAHTVDLDGHPTGVYLLRVQGKGRGWTERVIVSR